VAASVEDREYGMCLCGVSSAHLSSTELDPPLAHDGVIALHKPRQNKSNISFSGLYHADRVRSGAYLWEAGDEVVAVGLLGHLHHLLQTRPAR
jgi:hypothetical protein